jgi:NAD(P)-dependent dehydrogenase (short-subunit alcohol dehydrogenase family)
MIVFSHEEQRQKENRMNKKLQDRVAIVIGSTSGIGQAIAETFAQEGAKVVITGRRQEKGDAIVKELEKQGLQTEFYQIDVTDPTQCKALIEDTVKKHGGLDILVNNAGIAQAASMEELDLALWDATYDTNIRSYFVLTKAALPHLVESAHGNILFTSSMAAIKPFDQQFSYGSTKAAVAHFMRMLAVSYAPKGIRVNAIAPGVIDTDILANAPDGYIQAIVDGIPMRRLGKPEEIAKLAVFLASDDASFITGQQIACCGGSSIL